MADIDATLSAFDYFHDWYVEGFALRNEKNPTCPDVLVLSLKLDTRRVNAVFRGVSRLGFDNGGTVNIVLSMERARPNTQIEALALGLLKNSLKGKTTGQHIVYLHPTAGFAVAAEFDLLTIHELE